MLEIEGKYDAELEFDLPDLTGTEGAAGVAEPVELTLEATYFDTPDHRLASAGVTLRRRTGGEDDGWHLKLPAAVDEEARHELRMALGQAVTTVPKRFRTTVTALAGDQELSPVATVTTRRVVRRLLDEDGRVLAEIAEDHVEAARTIAGGDGHPQDTPPLSWHEIEVELVEGERKLLERVGERLTRAGARPTQRRSKLAEVLGDEAPPPEAPSRAKDSVQRLVQHRLTTLVAEMRARDPLVREGLPEGVHTMRVAIRRLRSTLATCRPFLDRSVTDPLRDELAWIADALGDARDAEVGCARLDKSVEALVEERPEVDWEADNARAALRAPLLDQQAEALAALDDAIASDRYARLLDLLRGLVADPPWDDKATKRIRGAYRRRVRRELDRLHRRMEAALDQDHTPDERAEALHEARKATKRARYAVEPLRPVYGDAARTLTKRLKRLQSALGQHQDTVVTRDFLHGLSRETNPPLDPAAALVAGALIERESRAAADYDERAVAAWRKVVASSSLI
jgi:CHAD domain-containing protein